jgi:hypothetical protein
VASPPRLYFGLMVYALNIMHRKDLILVCCEVCAHNRFQERLTFALLSQIFRYGPLLVTWRNKLGISQGLCVEEGFWSMESCKVDQAGGDPSPNTPWKLLEQGELSWFSSELTGTHTHKFETHYVVDLL